MAVKLTVLECKCGRRWKISPVVLARPLSCEECFRYYFFERNPTSRKARRSGDYKLYYIGCFKNKKEREARTLDLGHAVKELPQFEV